MEAPTLTVSLTARRAGRLLPFALAALALVAFHLTAIRQPLAHEELLWWFRLGSALAADGRMPTVDGRPWSDNPPLYGLVLAATFRLAGAGAVPARLVGLTLGVVTLLVFLRVIAAIRARYAPALSPGLAVALYVSHPVMVQATLLLEPDAVLAPLAFLLFADHAVRSDVFDRGAGVVRGGLLLVPIALAKIYDVVPLLAALAVVLWTRDGWPAAARRLGGLVGVGLVAFAGVWVPVTRLLAMDPLETFRYMAWSVAVRVGADPRGRAAELPKDALQVLLWLSPVLVLVVHAVIVRAFWRPSWPLGTPGARLLTLWGVLHLDLFMFGIGPLYGFPKYHVPGVPLLLAAALIALTAVAPLSGRATAVGVGVGAVSAVVLHSAIGDLLHTARVGLKALALAGSPGLAAAAGALGVAVLASLAFPVALALAWPGRPRGSRQTAALALLASHTGLMLGLVVSHLGAGYVTRYAYGEQGLAEAVALIRREAAPGRVVAPLHVTHALDRAPLAVTDRFWAGEGGELLRLARASSTCCVVWSLAHHSLAQLRHLQGLVPELERAGLVRHEVGTFAVWYRPRP